MTTTHTDENQATKDWNGYGVKLVNGVPSL